MAGERRTMKKNTPRKPKLSLHRETIAALQGPWLQAVDGGVTVLSGCTVPCQTGTRCNISLCICD
jgi:hypothetical protein